jgi:homoserine dehydrogenase
VIIIDVTAAKGEQITKFHLDAISPQHAHRIVTANKNVVSLESQSVFDEVTGNHGIYNYDTAVMAGAGVLDFIIESKDVHDDVLSIEGCFS